MLVMIKKAVEEHLRTANIYVRGDLEFTFGMVVGYNLASYSLRVAQVRFYEDHCTIRHSNYGNG